MIQLYTAPSCLSCRKVKKYFKDNNINFIEKNILNTRLHRDDILRMLISSENGFEDIISTRSKIFKDQGLNIDDMSTNALMEFIVKNPTVLKRPIIVSDLELQVGYNEEDITIFLPEELRKCSNCFPIEDGCEYVTNIKFD